MTHRRIEEKRNGVSDFGKVKSFSPMTCAKIKDPIRFAALTK